MDVDPLPAALTRRSFLQTAGVAAGALALGGAGASGAAGRPRPNIVFILADDLGWGELGCYGQQIIRTPNLDRMAEEGVRFTDYYSAAPICAPSRASILTGKHQGHCGIRHNSINEIPTAPQSSIPREDPTFAELLQDAGYRTGLFGKWGFGPDDRQAGSGPLTAGGDPAHPLQRGFDEFVGFIYHHHATNGYWADYWWEGDRQVEIPANVGGAQGQYNPDAYTQRGLDFMSREAQAGRPFAAWFSTILPHTPNHVPDFSEYDHLPYANDTKKHAAMITHMDRHVGLVLDRLHELGIADDTVVVFTSDNGPHDETPVYGGTDPVPLAGVTSAADVAIFDSNGPFRGVKQNLYEGGIRMPMVVWGPGVLDKQVRGTTSDHPWAHYDLMATFASFAGARVPADTDGISVRPLLEGRTQAQPEHDYLYWERFRAGAPTAGFYANERGRHGRFAQALRKGDWKLMRWAPGTADDGSLDVNPAGVKELVTVPVVRVPKELWDVELYDLAADPGETMNVARLHPSVVAELAALMDEAHTAYEAY